MAAQVMGKPMQQQMGGGAGEMFNNYPKVLIKQEWAALEMCSCEAKNRYRVSQPKDDNKEGDVFLYINEESNCLERICCSANRSLTLQVHEGSTKDGPVQQSMQKPFHCQGCCFLRPHFDVFDAGGAQIGKIEDPCKICTMDQKVYVGQGEAETFRTNGSVCQAGMCCPCCAEVKFEVQDSSSRAVAEIVKPPLDLTECCCATNRFLVDFKSVEGANERRMIFAAAMLLDLEYFEQNKNDSS
mmetsp:Transcript_33587/g.94332  ORF Transcript_33587/g.94332 Transcript_33587/m.94332 type:complete len:242 (-) Transcript_33587:139-864(-)